MLPEGTCLLHSVGLCSHSGCLQYCMSLILFQDVLKFVLPSLDGLYLQVKSTLENRVETEVRAEAMKVHEALLVRPCHTYMV